MLFRTWDNVTNPEFPEVSEVVDHAGVTHTVVTSHTLIKRILADPVRFCPDNALDAVTPMPVSVLRVLARHGFRLPATLANNGTQSHPAIREVTFRALHPARVESIRPWLEDLVAERIDRLTKRLDTGETVDLYADFTADLPLLVLARLIGLPDAEAAAVKEFSQAALELFWAPVDEPRQLALADIVGRFHASLRAFVKTAGGTVGELREHTSAHGLHPDTPIAALFFLLVAGQETTSQFLTLLMHRLTVERHALTAPFNVDDVVEEGLRLVPPIPTWRRVAADQTKISDYLVPKGRSLVLWLARAGLEIAGPGFVPGTRGSRRHLAFGAGAHRCVGAQLARMEAAVVISLAAPLLQKAQVIRPPWFPDNLSFRMPDSFVVSF
ncbi:MAG TPA: cytochrome P450 [Candidatus Limnocylindrales bacterium]